MVLPLEARTDSNYENGEGESLRGRNVMVVAGATGSELDLVKRLHNLGAYVIPTTRNIAHFDKNLRPVLGTERVFPLVFDITVEDEVDGALQTLRDHEIGISDCVISAEGGMESFSQSMTNALMKVKIKAPKDRQADIQKLKGDMREWVDKSRQAAMAVNLHGPRFLLHRLRNLLPKGARLVFDSSWWSSLYGSGVQVPPFYDAVAASKNLFEKVLAADSIDLQSRYIYIRQSLPVTY